MKKYFLFTVIMYFAILSVSQAQLGRRPYKKLSPDLKNLRANNKNSSISKSTLVNAGWFNYGVAAETYYGSQSTYSGNFLFPDSIAYGEFEGGGFSAMWVHHLAELVDFRSPVFQSDLSTAWVSANPTSQIKIDSLSIVYGYTRVQTSIVDTLIVTFFNGPVTGAGTFENTTLVNTYGFPGGADTITIRTVGYNQSLNALAAASPTTSVPAGQMVFKILLTQADTASGVYKEKVFGLPVPFFGTADNLYCASVQFVPGYAYSQGEHINYTANVFQFATMEENGPNTMMNYFDCNVGSASCDYSSSSLITMYERYNMGLFWDGHFTTPFMVPDPSYTYEHHLVSFRVTDDISSCQANAQFTIMADSLNPGIYNAYETSTGNGSLTYFWDFGDNTTSTLHYPSHQYAVPGQYIVCLTVTSTIGTATCSNMYCDSSSVQKPAGYLMGQFNVIPQIVTSINNIESLSKINAFPNPMLDEVIIELTGNESITLHYILVDALGRMVFSGTLENKKTKIKSESLEKGFYNLIISNDKNELVRTIKLVK